MSEFQNKLQVWCYEFNQNEPKYITTPVVIISPDIDIVENCRWIVTVEVGSYSCKGEILDTTFQAKESAAEECLSQMGSYENQLHYWCEMNRTQLPIYGSICDMSRGTECTTVNVWSMEFVLYRPIDPSKPLSIDPSKPLSIDPTKPLPIDPTSHNHYQNPYFKSANDEVSKIALKYLVERFGFLQEEPETTEDSGGSCALL